MKKFAPLLALVLAVMMLVACGPKTEPATPATPDVAVPTEAAPVTPDAVVPTEEVAPPTEPAAEGPDTSQAVEVGVAIYKFDDTFMTGVRNAIDAQAKEINATVDIVDSQNKQPTQNDQVDAFLTKGSASIAINAVDRTAAGPIIEKAKADSKPVVFFNREPEKKDMDSYDKVWYVGAKAEESGTMTGQILADYWKAHPEADKNKDGVMQYVMLTGEPGHQDATLRTEYSIKAIEAAGIKVAKLEEDTAMWDKSKAADKMQGWLTKHPDEIEAVLGNNDDMALGAIEALKGAGYITDPAKFVPVVGVDATAPALESMGKGELLGTVLNDADNQGKATINIAAAAARGQEINEANIGFPVTDGKYVWVPYVMVTVDNYKEFMK